MPTMSQDLDYAMWKLNPDRDAATDEEMQRQRFNARYLPADQRLQAYAYYDQRELNKREQDRLDAELAQRNKAYADKQALGKQVLSDYQLAQDEARAANEARYQELLAGYGTGQDAAMQMAAEGLGTLQQSRQTYNDAFTGLGDQQRQDIRSQYENAYTGARQDLVSRGLSGTTVQDTMHQGYTRDAIAEEARMQKQYDDQLLNANTEFDKSIAEYQKYMGEVGSSWALGRLGAIEGRTDEYPDLTPVLQLLSA